MFPYWFKSATGCALVSYSMCFLLLPLKVKYYCFEEHLIPDTVCLMWSDCKRTVILQQLNGGGCSTVSKLLNEGYFKMFQISSIILFKPVISSKRHKNICVCLWMHTVTNNNTWKGKNLLYALVSLVLLLFC